MTKTRRLTIALWAAVVLLAVNAALFATAPTAALPGSLANYFFGPKMVRAEVIVKDGGIHDYRIDRGRIRAIGPNTLTLVEADGMVAVIPVSPTAQVTLGGANVPLSSLKRGLKALTVRDGDAPAQVVRASRK